MINYSGLLMVSKKMNDEAEKAIVLYEIKLNKYYKTYGSFPESLDQINIYREKIFFIINPITINYLTENSINLYYNQFPFGPKHVYNLNSQSWNFEE